MDNENFELICELSKEYINRQEKRWGYKFTKKDAMFSLSSPHWMSRMGKYKSISFLFMATGVMVNGYYLYSYKEIIDKLYVPGEVIEQLILF